VSAGCPAWCTEPADHTVHISDMHLHDQLAVCILQERTLVHPLIYIGKCPVTIAHAPRFAHLFALLGAAELAATVRRLGEIAEAEQPVHAAATS
jgi:hypothetical protein